MHVVELTDRVVSLCARKEVDGGVKVVLGYETILKLWAEELLCARAGVEGGFEPGEWDRDRHARLVFGGHVQVEVVPRRLALLCLCNSHALMNAPPVLQSNKASPSLTNHKLPALPSPADPAFFSPSPPPPPPPKFIPDQDTSLCSNGLRLPPIDVTLSIQPSGQGLPLPSSLLRLLMLFASSRPWPSF